MRVWRTVTWAKPLQSVAQLTSPGGNWSSMRRAWSAPSSRRTRSCTPGSHLRPHSASLFVNRSTGLCCATTAWGTREAIEASRPSADNMRTRTAGDAGGEIVDVHEFDLAYAHLHVPEMA